MSLNGIAHGIRAANEILETVAYIRAYRQMNGRTEAEITDKYYIAKPIVICLTITSVVDTIFLGLRCMNLYSRNMEVFLFLPRVLVGVLVENMRNTTVSSTIRRCTMASQTICAMKIIFKYHDAAQKFPNGCRTIRQGLTITETAIRVYSIIKLLSNTSQPAQRQN